MINLDKSENWSNWKAWVKNKKIYYGSKIGLQVYGGIIDFAMCYYYIPLEFKGEIERITRKAVCFKRIYVLGMYPDGMCFDGKEDHVWIDKHGIEGYCVGDCLSFFAEPYRYIKTGNGKQIDFGLRNLQSIKRIEKYELPFNEELILQSMDAIICETCYIKEQCFGGMCIRDKKERQSLRKDMLKVVKNQEKGEI